MYALILDLFFFLFFATTAIIPAMINAKIIPTIGPVQSSDWVGCIGGGGGGGGGGEEKITSKDFVFDESGKNIVVPALSELPLYFAVIS